MIRLIFFAMLLLYSIMMYSQITIKSDSICQYCSSDRVYSYRHLLVKNSTDQIALCWFNKANSLYKKDPFYSYFIVPKGKLSLYNIIVESGSTLEIENIEQFPKLFDTFYKIIDSNSSFSVYLLTDKTVDDLEECITIQVMSLKDLEKYLDDTMIAPFRKLSYKPNDIVISITD